MLDRIPTPGQEGRVLVTPEDGSVPFYAKIQMADNPTQNGDPFAKFTMLHDAVAAAYDKDNKAVPNDIFKVLSRFHKGLGNEYVWEKSDGTFVNSPDPSAYPVDDGYTYTALGQLGSKVRIEMFTYTGTGKYGQGSPNTLTFPETPKMWGIFRSVGNSTSNYNHAIFDPRSITTSYTDAHVASDADARGTWRIKKSGNTFSWYDSNQSSAARQFNAQGFVYYGFAIY